MPKFAVPLPNIFLMMVARMVAVFSAAGLFASPCLAVAVYATDDTTIVQSAPNESRTGWSFVQPGAGQTALFSFPIKDALPTITPDSIEQVLLVVSVVTIGLPGSLEALRVLGTFTESSNPTFSVRPQISAGGTGVAFALNKGQLRPYYIDVTRLVKDALAANAQSVSIAIAPAPSSPSASAVIWSRESGTITPWTPAVRPYLDVTVAARPAATLPQYLWLPSDGQYSCQSVCSASKLIPAATPQGMVCKDASGQLRSVEYRVPNCVNCSVVYHHYECGTQYPGGTVRTAQCSCVR